MKTIFKWVCVIAAIIAIIGMCNFLFDQKPTTIGEGKNTDLTNTDLVKSTFDNNAKAEAFGKVLHEGVVAKDVLIQGNKIDDGITSINIISKGKNPSIVTLVCESRSDTWAVAHNTYRADGTGVSDATDMSIMNYPKGVTTIREIDESRDPIFSTANGDKQIYQGLLKLQDLDPESTVAFTFEKQSAEGYSETEGWSALYKVKDIVKGLSKVALYDCKKASIDGVGLEVQFVSNDQLRALAAGKK